MFYGLTLVVIIYIRPSGVWPWLARMLRPRGARAMTPLLSVDGVSKHFRGLLAVDRVSFEVAAGEILAVIGPNGAGKTTLFNMIAGVLAPDDGTIRFDGERIDGLAPDAVCRRGIGRTFQLVRPFPALSVEDNVVVGALLRRHDVASARRHARRRCWSGSISSTSARSPPRRSRCPTASGSRSRARSRPTRSSCCSTR